jgi:hypothetical protein
VGYSILRWNKDTGEEIKENNHWVVQGTKQYENHKYVPGNRNVGFHFFSSPSKSILMLYRTTISERAQRSSKKILKIV